MKMFNHNVCIQKLKDFLFEAYGFVKSLKGKSFAFDHNSRIHLPCRNNSVLIKGRFIQNSLIRNINQSQQIIEGEVEIFGLRNESGQTIFLGVSYFLYLHKLDYRKGQIYEAAFLRFHSFQHLFGFAILTILEGVHHVVSGLATK